MTRESWVPFLLAVGILSFSEPVLASGKLQVDGRHFVDADGGVVMLRGLNVAGDFKTPPFLTIHDPQLLDPLVGWGVSVIRLLFNWEAFETERGRYDLDYLAAYGNIVAWAWDRGILVIVDFHQDAFSRYQVDGCGDGFPAWAVPNGITRDTPDNGERCGSWGVKMLTDWDMHQSWQHFHADGNGVRTSYVNMVRFVAAHFSHHEGVIGYDLMNEPWGNERTEIASLYETLATAVRDQDPDAILFICPHALSSSGLRSRLPSFTFDNFAYAPHYYDASALLNHFWFGNSPERALNTKRLKAKELDAPLFIGEFGCPADTVFGAGYMDAFYGVMDKWFVSGTQWNYTPGWTPGTKDGWNGEDLSVVDETGRMRENYRLRPYPRRVSGLPTKFRVQRGHLTGALSVVLQWEHDPAKGETKLFLPKRVLFGDAGFRVTLTGAGLSYRYDAEERFLILSASTAGPKGIWIHRGRAKL